MLSLTIINTGEEYNRFFCLYFLPLRINRKEDVHMKQRKL